MDIFYFAVFALFGLFNVLAAVRNIKWYVSYWARGSKNTAVVRFGIGFVGVLLIAFGTAVLTDLI